MNHERTELISAGISMLLHAVVIILMTMIMVQQPVKRVALITDVTLIDLGKDAGIKGMEEKAAVGAAEKQEKIAETAKPQPVKKPQQQAKPAVSQPDVKELLKKIEREKSALDMGISREKLRTASADVSESSEGREEEAYEGETVAGGDPEVTGALSARKYAKIDWRFPANLPEESELAVELIVMPSGVIRSVKLVRTSGYPDLDRQAVSQARKLSFEPLPSGSSQEDQMGILLFKFGAQK